MPHSDIMPSYRLILSSDEYRLVTLALAGKIKAGSDDESDARKLNIHLCRMRAKIAKDQAQIADIALRKAEEIEIKGLEAQNS